TEEEAHLIMKYCNLERGQTVLDLGCGIGRHSITLAKMGLNVTGIDYIKNLIVSARNKANRLKANHLRFVHADCRNINLGQKFNAIICLYDVIGTYADNSENVKILNNIFTHLKLNGRVLLSVMNYELTERIAKHVFSFERNPNELLDFPASQTMERTGAIFNPDYYIIDKDTCVVYRKEQFLSGNSLPTELIVRDRRFRKEDIEQMCDNAGLEVLWLTNVNYKFPLMTIILTSLSV
ncbi:unnamed protein product, partial [marine sediment metagenome]